LDGGNGKHQNGAALGMQLPDLSGFVRLVGLQQLDGAYQGLSIFAQVSNLFRTDLYGLIKSRKRLFCQLSGQMLSGRARQ
jgi:hypothetical protein